jgi:hypothetical protein
VCGARLSEAPSFERRLLAHPLETLRPDAASRCRRHQTPSNLE